MTRLLVRHPGGRRGVLTNNGSLEEDALARLYPDVLGSFGYLFLYWRLTANKPDPASRREEITARTLAVVEQHFHNETPETVRAAYQSAARRAAGQDRSR